VLYIIAWLGHWHSSINMLHWQSIWNLHNSKPLYNLRRDEVNVLRIYPPHKRISSQDITCSSLIWIISEVTEQLEFDKHMNDVSQGLNDIRRRERYFFWFDSVQKCFFFQYWWKAKWKGVAHFSYFVRPHSTKHCSFVKPRKKP